MQCICSIEEEEGEEEEDGDRAVKSYDDGIDDDDVVLAVPEEFVSVVCTAVAGCPVPIPSYFEHIPIFCYFFKQSLVLVLFF